MGVENILHMNTGNGELSYAKNSLLQEIAIRKTMPVLKHTIKSMADLDVTIFSHCFKIADLGCSSGTNTLLVARIIIDIVDEACKENDRKAPQFQVCLNDLYDFRKFLKLRSEEIVCGGRMVLTFLGRSNADPTSDDDEVRDVIHKEGSFSLDSLDVFQGNWDPYDTDYTNVNDFKEDSHRHGKNAAQVLRAVTEPLLTSHFGNSVIDAVFKKLEKHVAEHLANKKTRYFNIEIAIRKTMPVLKHTIKSMADLGINIFGHCFTIADLGCSSSTNTLLVARTIIDIVDEACKENDRKAPQFQVCLNDLYDFRKFLKLRSEEIVCGGRMVLTFLGRSNADPTSDDDINSFNLPAYTPCEDEVRNVIHNEGSFSLDSLDVFQGNWDPYDTDYTNVNDFKEDSHRHGKNAAQVLRAVTEPLLTSHFGNSVIDAVFKKLEKHVAEHLANKKTRYFNIVISLINK
ncbi:hypothetical protein Ccrd_008755 [Cynara cardunculus var. scolymus]|uniref:SAM dependent carboxyl methyltransferase n=1 Tax=Cynara cardunculus var. scolymus TaxID=59895 RepID=A0A118JSI8_CYNCS|nr:hypothetical protein Ccrd_008755 [Cynara cardunculus var. scolymus]